MRITKKFLSWCKRDTAEARLERTLFQGVLSSVPIETIVKVLDLPDWVSMICIPILMGFTASFQKYLAQFAPEEAEVRAKHAKPKEVEYGGRSDID